MSGWAGVRRVVTREVDEVRVDFEHDQLATERGLGRLVSQSVSQPVVTNPYHGA